MENHSTIFIGALISIVVLAATYYFMGGSNSKQKRKEDGGPPEKKADSGKAKTVQQSDAEKFPAGKLSIFFGSQTGTAEGFARVLMEEGKSKGFNAKMADLEDFDPDALASTNLCIFLMATYGEGEPTDNANKFFRWAKDDGDEVDSTFLSKVKFTVFGLGNRQYEHFNRMGKFTNQKLEKFGGVRVYDYGEGDDDGSLEEDFDNWKSKMWPSLVQQFHPNAASQASGDESVKAKVQLSFNADVVEDAPLSVFTQFVSHDINTSTRHFFTATSCSIGVNRELRFGQDVGSTRHIEIQIGGTGVQYETADNLAVLPENDASAVSALAVAQGYSLGQVIRLKAAAGVSDFKHPFPTPCTVGEALTRYFDIQGLPRHSAVASLLPYVTDAAQKDWLTKLLAKDNRAAFTEYIEKGGRSLVDLLTGDLSSCKIPLSDFFHIAAFMQPRYYTISSSSSCHPDSVHITVSVTEFKLPTGKLFRGVCSSYLQGLSSGSSSCRVFVRPSSFRLPKSVSTPIIMVGPGTGIAPMRALLQEREFQQKQASAAQKGVNTLYFGCKKSTEDYIYKDELAAFTQRGVLDRCHVAFSREQATKVYVQHLLAQPENATALVKELEQGAFVFVCGATAMGSDVLEAVTVILQKEKGISKESAVQFVKDLQQQGRYVQELWTA